MACWRISNLYTIFPWRPPFGWNIEIRTSCRPALWHFPWHFPGEVGLDYFERSQFHHYEGWLGRVRNRPKSWIADLTCRIDPPSLRAAWGIQFLSHIHVVILASNRPPRVLKLPSDASSLRGPCWIPWSNGQSHGDVKMQRTPVSSGMTLMSLESPRGISPTCPNSSAVFQVSE